MSSSSSMLLDPGDLPDVLSRGACGTVQLLYTKSHGAVAVKIWDLRYGRGKRSQHAPAMHPLPQDILAERRACARIGLHPNVVEMRRFAVEGNFAYIVLGRLTGTLIQAWTSEEHLDEYTYARYFKEMAEALEYVHSVGVVHRDVKQDKFMLGGCEGRTVKLCDFGNSAVLNGGRGLSGQVGTAPYMAPEIISTWAKHGPRVDVWSLGVIVYNAFFGCWPYQPKENTEKEMMKAILHGDVLPSFAPVSSFPLNVVSEEGIHFVKAILNRDPVTRPSAAACLELGYLKNWRYNQLEANARGAKSISLAPLLKDALRCGVFKLELPKVEDCTPIQNTAPNLVETMD